MASSRLEQPDTASRYLLSGGVLFFLLGEGAPWSRLVWLRGIGITSHHLFSFGVGGNVNDTAREKDVGPEYGVIYAKERCGEWISVELP